MVDVAEKRVVDTKSITDKFFFFLKAFAYILLGMCTSKSCMMCSGKAWIYSTANLDSQACVIGILVFKEFVSREKGAH